MKAELLRKLLTPTIYTAYDDNDSYMMRYYKQIPSSGFGDCHTLRRMRITQILKELNESIVEKYNLSGEKQINSGWCFVWAWVAHKLTREVKLCKAYHHAFIKVGELYYDAEKINGVRSVIELPTCSFGSLEFVEFFTEKEFYKDWTKKVCSPNRSFLKNKPLLDEIKKDVQRRLKNT